MPHRIENGDNVGDCSLVMLRQIIKVKVYIWEVIYERLGKC